MSGEGAAAYDAGELAHRLLGAARTDPGEPDAGLGPILAASGIVGEQAREVVASVQDAQLSHARLRRRTAELEALFSTARELVRLQDVDEVLDRLVERAHQLMGTDVTYLSEVEGDAGALRVRHSVGTVTPGFRDLVVPAGFGLASKVAGTREPSWVSQYTSMREAPHDPRIDEAVAAEGLVSFLGVPLAVGDQVLGALFACNRFSYDYTPDEVLLLSAFADHAAAVLHTAHALAERATAVERAEHAYRELHEHLAATELASGVHEELTTAVMSGATVVDLVATVARRLGRRVWALDGDVRPLAAGRGLPRRGELIEAVARSRDSGYAHAIADSRGHWLVVAIPGADRSSGAIVAETDDPDDDVGRRTLERAAHAAALVSFKRDAVRAVQAEREARWLLDVIEHGEADAAAEVPRSMTGAAVTACAVLEVGAGESAAAVAAASAVVGEHGVVAARQNQLIIAWSGPDPTAATERVRAAVAERLAAPMTTAVIRRGVRTTAALGSAVERAASDLRLLGPLGISGATISSDVLVPYHALTSSDEGAAERFVDEILGPVIAWDDRRGTDLFDTVAAYFESGQSPQRVAAGMRVHKNTVQQRLQRVQELVSGSWDEPEFRFRLEAAVRLERLRRAARESVSSAAGRGGAPLL